MKFIILHHTGGTDFNKWEDTSHHTFETVNEYHRQKWGVKSSLGHYIGYQYFIDKGGKLTQGRADTDKGLHTIGYNEDSIGICLAGNFDLTKPTDDQIQTLKKLLKEKQQQYGIPTSNIFAHRHFAQKTCYGMNLTDDWARNLILETQYDNKEIITFIKLLISLKILTGDFIKILPFLGKKKLGKRSDNDREGCGNL